MPRSSKLLVLDMTLTLPRWFDLHVHLRQGEALPAYVSAHLEMACAGVLAMPNTKPPVTRVSGSNSDVAWTIENYLEDLKAAGGSAFDDMIVPLYLTPETTPRMIEEGAASGLLRTCKFYPPHGTTNSEFGAPMDSFLGSDVFRAMEQCDIVLNIHGEKHALAGPDYIDQHCNAESIFYRETMPRLLEAHPGLRIVCEHLTTKDAVEFVQEAPDGVAATITPQHLLYTMGDLIQGLKYHLYCLPIVKFEADRGSLRAAIVDTDQHKFFAGTDSAPHTMKATEVGCAAGCFTGGCAPQLYAMAFEEAGADLATEKSVRAFRSFLCENGPRYYGIPLSVEQFTLTKSPSAVSKLQTPDGPVTPLPLGLNLELSWSLDG